MNLEEKPKKTKVVKDAKVVKDTKVVKNAKVVKDTKVVKETAPIKETEVAKETAPIKETEVAKETAPIKENEVVTAEATVTEITSNDDTQTETVVVKNPNPIGAIIKFLLRYAVLIAVLGYGVYYFFSGYTYSHKNYVNATLDMLFKGKFDQYIEVTNATKAKAEEFYKDGILNYLDYLSSDYGVVFTEENRDLYFNNAKELYKEFKYSVKTTSSTSISAVVEITYYPLVYTEEYYNELDKIIGVFTEEVETLEVDEAFNNYINARATKLFDKKYYDKGEAKTLEINIKRSGDYWILDFEKIQTLYNLMFEKSKTEE